MWENVRALALGLSISFDDDSVNESHAVRPPRKMLASNTV